MLNETKQHFFKKLIEDTIGYYRIYDFLKVKVTATINKVSTFTTSENFWKAILQGDFRERHNEISLENNQIVVLKDFFLTEWTPKLPGRVWTSDGDINLIDGMQDIVGCANIFDRIYEVLGPLGKSKMISGGFGTVRIKQRVNSDYYMLLNAVSVNDWHCDYGIPIVVSKAVYERYIHYSYNQGSPWIEELKGILCLNSHIDGNDLITSSIGAKLDNETRDLLSDIPNLQKCFIYVSSPLDVKIRFNNTHPEAIAWTMFRTEIPTEPLRLTYARFNPIEEESVKEAVNFINSYVLEFNGTEILTDFDGQKRRLISKTNLANPKNFYWVQRRTLETINNWVKQASNY